MISRSPIRLGKLRTVRTFCAWVRIKSHHVLAVTSAQVRRQLVEEEAVAARLGEIAAHDVYPSALIYTGLELEEYQYAQFPFSSMLFLIYMTDAIWL